MGFLSDALGAVGSIGGLVSGFQQNSLASQQFAANMEYAKNRHQYEVADLRAAGLNPILSANGGQAYLPSPTAGQRTDPWQRAVANASAARQLDVLKSQDLKNRAEAYQAAQYGDSQLWQRKVMESEYYRNIAAGTNQFGGLALMDSQISLNKASERLAMANAEYRMKEIATYDQSFAARLNLIAAQTFQAYKAGEMSAAAAVNQFAQAVTQGHLQGYYDAQTSNQIIEGQRLKVKLANEQATAGIQSNETYQTGKTILSDILGLGSSVLGIRRGW